MPKREGLHDKNRCARLAALFKTLSHPQRLLIFCCLCEKESTAGELRSACRASQSIISQHLTRMRLEGLVTSRRNGHHMHFQIADPKLPALIRNMEKIING